MLPWLRTVEDTLITDVAAVPLGIHTTPPRPPDRPAQLFGSGLIGLREGLEAGIVVMVLIAFLVKSQRCDALKWVWRACPRPWR